MIIGMLPFGRSEEIIEDTQEWLDSLVDRLIGPRYETQKTVVMGPSNEKRNPLMNFEECVEARQDQRLNPDKPYKKGVRENTRAVTRSWGHKKRPADIVRFQPDGDNW